jgi:hypothetical protein
MRSVSKSESAALPLCPYFARKQSKGQKPEKPERAKRDRKVENPWMEPPNRPNPAQGMCQPVIYSALYRF